MRLHAHHTLGVDASNDTIREWNILSSLHHRQGADLAQQIGDPLNKRWHHTDRRQANKSQNVTKIRAAGNTIWNDLYSWSYQVAIRSNAVEVILVVEARVAFIRSILPSHLCGVAELDSASWNFNNIIYMYMYWVLFLWGGVGTFPLVCVIFSEKRAIER